jgi:hypothetical protein
MYYMCYVYGNQFFDAKRNSEPTLIYFELFCLYWRFRTSFLPVKTLQATNYQKKNYNVQTIGDVTQSLLLQWS